MKLEVNLASLAMKNPFTVASGTFASGKEFAEIWQNSPELLEESLNRTLRPFSFDPKAPLSLLGAVTTKGVSLEPWLGNEGIRITETASGILNSIGLQNPGVEEFCSTDLSWLSTQKVPVVVNISGHTIDEYAAVIQRLEREKTIDAYEINISCPNVDCGGMSFGTDIAAAGDVTKACRKVTDRTLIVKLTPNVTDIAEIARACEANGADALSLINTVGGMAIEARSRTSVFDRKVAGLSGPAIKPIALYAVHRVSQAVRLPLIGMGGISKAEDVVEFLLAGASAVAIGSHNFTDPLAVLHLLAGFIRWCDGEGVRDVHELIGGLR